MWTSWLSLREVAGRGADSGLEGLDGDPAIGGLKLRGGLDPGEFLRRAAETTTFVHVGYCAVKAFCFGAIICLVSCFCGFSSRSGPAGVGQATNTAVVSSAVACAILNYWLSSWMFGQ